MNYSDKRARAFNRGCDARLSGSPLSRNPYASGGDVELVRQFYSGWMHVDEHWGRLARPWHRVVPLPAVRETTGAAT